MESTAPAREASDARPATLWRISRVTAALIAFPCGAVAAALSLQIRWEWSGGVWRSARYSWNRGGWGWQLFDTALAISLGALLATRLTWLLIDLAARWTGRELPRTFVHGQDFWVVVVPGAILAYLIYVANVRDVSFWPTALVLAGASIFRSGFRKSAAIRRAGPQAGRLTMK